jgi:tRNA pseudouridine55 synthase
VHRVDLLAVSDRGLEIEVRCSPGTYVRALARDLGEDLGVGGHLTALRRIRSGAFGLEHSVPGDDLAAARERVIPLGELLPELPGVRVGEAGIHLVRHGRDIGRESTVGGFPEEPVERVRILDESGRLLAVAVPRPGDTAGSAPRIDPVLHPEVVLMG